MKFARPTRLLAHMERQVIASTLPKFPSEFLEFVKAARPKVGEITRNFEMIPMWTHIYNNMQSNMIIICGRQVFKSTFLVDLMLWISTTKRRAHSMYISHDIGSAEAFSDERVREEGFLSNSIMKKFLPYERRAAKKVIKLLNGSFMRFTHAKGRYGNAEGYTNSVLAIDEIQKHLELQHLGIARRTLKTTKGPTILTGIGIAEGSELHYMVNEESDIYEWQYKDSSTFTEQTEITLSNGEKKNHITTWPKQGWRKNLTYDKDGLIDFTPEEAQLYLKGKFVCINPLPNGEKREWITYHMPQSIFPQTPLTINQAKNLYHSNIQDSIEYQQIHNSPMEYLSHCEGWFYPDEARPLTPAAIRKCYDDTQEFLTPLEIRKLKESKKIDVLLGIDWGSNQDNASFTAGAIILRWKGSDRIPVRYQLAYLDKRPIGDEVDPALHFHKMILEYEVDFCVADMGYGKDEISLMQKGGFTKGGEKLHGLGTSKVMGVFTLGNLTEETKRYYEDALLNNDKVSGKNLSKFSIDKTEYVDKVISIIKSTIPDLDDPTNKDKAKPKFVIPYGPGVRIEIDKLERDLAAIQRADKKEETEIQSPMDKRQHAQKLYAHAEDTVMAILYAIVAADNYHKGIQVWAVNPGGNIPRAYSSNGRRYR